ncbi:MAG: hypothetical protein JWR20_1882, partial [Marmoricola sp.]|nr:hypothetical protein [Marmoricola sp.]
MSDHSTDQTDQIDQDQDRAPDDVADETGAPAGDASAPQDGG